jgi:hypothetical protein
MKHLEATAMKPYPRRIPLLAATVAALLLAGCATVPQPPTEALHAAEVAIANAEQARVADFASPELGAARSKLTEARAAVARQDMATGQRLAEQSRADAELASAKAEANKAKAVNDEMRKSTESLEQEMQRNNGGRR